MIRLSKNMVDRITFNDFIGNEKGQDTNYPMFSLTKAKNSKATVIKTAKNTEPAQLPWQPIWINNKADVSKVNIDKMNYDQLFDLIKVRCTSVSILVSNCLLTTEFKNEDYILTINQNSCHPAQICDKLIVEELFYFNIIRDLAAAGYANCLICCYPSYAKGYYRPCRATSEASDEIYQKILYKIKTTIYRSGGSLLAKGVRFPQAIEILNSNLDKKFVIYCDSKKFNFKVYINNKLVNC